MNEFWDKITSFSVGRLIVRGWEALHRVRPLIADGLIIAFIIIVSAVTYALGGREDASIPVTFWTYFLTVLIPLPLFLRRKQPLLALVAVAGLAGLFQLIESANTIEVAQSLPLMCGLYSVGSYEKRRAVGFAAAILAAEAFLGVYHLEGATTGIPEDTTWIVLSLVIGAAIRGKRDRASFAEQSRNEDAQRMVNEERLRIARELHDVVAHSIATISVQAGMATHVFDTQPEQARAALKEIRAASRDALQEIRATLGLLRSSNGSEERTPAPHLDQLGDLVSRTESGGVRVSLTTSGIPRLLPTTVDVTAYRIVQEALTNVVRHAGPEAKVTVSINYFVDTIELGIVDSGPRHGISVAPTSIGSQLGLIGMQERVASIGGQLVTGPRPAGGFEVRARLPLGDNR